MATNNPDETRHNFYHAIHKALRLGHCRMLSALGSHDHRDARQTARLMAELRTLLGLAASHLDGENREIHAALEERAPGASAHAAEDHNDHERSFEELEALIRAVEEAAPMARARACHALYQRYAVFAAEDLAHMHAEETELLATLHRSFSDEELHAIEGRIVAAIPPHKMAGYMALMAPALNHCERVDLLAKLRQALPEPAFEGLLSGTIRPALAPADYTAAIGELMLRAA